MALMAAFSPGLSPPAVNTPICLVIVGSLLAGSLRFFLLLFHAKMHHSQKHLLATYETIQITAVSIIVFSFWQSRLFSSFSATGVVRWAL
jgi:hypothetical protein